MTLSYNGLLLPAPSPGYCIRSVEATQVVTEDGEHLTKIEVTYKYEKPKPESEPVAR